MFSQDLGSRYGISFDQIDHTKQGVGRVVVNVNIDLDAIRQSITGAPAVATIKHHHQIEFAFWLLDNFLVARKKTKDRGQAIVEHHLHFFAQRL